MRILPDANALTWAAAEYMVALAANQERFTIALAGGATPRALYQLLAADPFATALDWSRVHLFWGDERCVPPDHPDSNYRMLSETLIGRVPLPTGNIHRILGELEPSKGAYDYEKSMADFFENRPQFDLVLLGMGDDGHTASLFPYTSALAETSRWAVATEVNNAIRWRITLTLPVLNTARRVLFLVSGSGKAARLRDVLQGPLDPQRMPAQLIQPLSGEILWMVDAAAAELLTPSD